MTRKIEHEKKMNDKKYIKREKKVNYKKYIKHEKKINHDKKKTKQKRKIKFLECCVVEDFSQVQQLQQV